MIAGGSALAAIAGPFGTWGLEIGPRFLYWLCVISIAWVQWLLLVWGLHRATSANPWPAGVCGTVASFLFAGLMAVEINLLHAWLPGAPGRSGVVPFLWLLGILLVFCWFAQLLVRYISLSPVGKPDASESGGESPFVKRIPSQIAGDLLCLRTEDHYLRIHTTAGNDLILLRLKDALQELQGANGLQVHRSYWVARSAVSAAERKGRKAALILKNGMRVPVSESFLPAVRAAGWLD